MKAHNNRRFFVWLALLPLLAMACGLLTPSTGEPVRPVKNTQAALPTIQNTRPAAAAPAAAVATAAPLPALSSNEEAVLVALYQRVNSSVVSIVTYTNQGQFLAPAAQGSGFVYDNSGYIVTNSHVVHGADSVDIVFADSTTITGDVVGEDLNADLAVIKIDQLPQGVQALPLGDMSNVAPGETVVAIGNPFGLGGTLTRGIVSAVGRTIPALTAFSIPQAIQTDAPINPGNSGGPLLNLRGEVIGVNAQIETGGTSNANSGVGFAIPSSIVGRVVPELIKNGEYQWGWLGVRGGSLNPALVQAMKLPVDKGAYIAEVVSGGPAEKAGLRGATGEDTVNGRRVETGGDVIIGVDGVPVNNFEDMLVYIALNTRPGQTVALTVIRNGQQQEINVTLEPRPNEAIDATNPQQP
jgi:serine protease Do